MLFPIPQITSLLILRGDLPVLPSMAKWRITRPEKASLLFHCTMSALLWIPLYMWYCTVSADWFSSALSYSILSIRNEKAGPIWSACRGREARKRPIPGTGAYSHPAIQREYLVKKSEIPQEAKKRIRKNGVRRDKNIRVGQISAKNNRKIR